MGWDAVNERLSAALAERHRIERASGPSAEVGGIAYASSMIRLTRKGSAEPTFSPSDLSAHASAHSQGVPANHPTGASNHDALQLTLTDRLGSRELPCLSLPLSAQGDRGIQNIRPQSRLGLTTFEDPKKDTTTFQGIRVAIGGGFAQEYQSLTHKTDATPNIVNGVNANALTPIGAGFNTAMANMNVNVQLAQGIRVALTS